MGCPTSYDGKNAIWSKGKLSQLTSGTSTSGVDMYTFNYNAYGQRTSKTYSFAEGSNPIYGGKLLSSEKRFYYDHAGRLIAENTTREYYGTTDENENIVFLYDGNTIVGLQHTVGGIATPYYFHRNPLGDVVGIYDMDGTLVAKYIYDAWGNCTISGDTTNYALAHANPIRYRGYYYDEDTGLYYCNARYYSPKWRRFISPETSALNPYAVNGLNTYIYANNNPVEIAHFHLNTYERVLNTYASTTSSGTYHANTNSMWLTVPSWLRYLSKANDLFAAGAHSYIVSKYLLQNLGFIDEMRMLGVNPATALGKLPQASYISKIGIAFSLLDAGIAFYDNLTQGNSFAEATLDGVLTFGKSAMSAWVGGAVGTNVGGLIGAGLGSLVPIPGVGTVVGFVAGTAVGMLTAWFVDDILGCIKDGLLEWIF